MQKFIISVKEKHSGRDVIAPYIVNSLDVLGKSVEKLKNNGSVATSNLANSGRVKKQRNYWTVGYTASYAWVVEYGRKAGTYPPIQPLMDWVHKKELHSLTKYQQEEDRKSTRLNSSHSAKSRMPSSA